VTLMVVGCLPGGDQLLGIGEPAPGDRTDGGIGGGGGGGGGGGRDHGDADVVVRDEDGATPAAIRQSSRAA